MVKVYFEAKHPCSCAELVAVFDNEITYSACYSALNKLAKKYRMFITESIEEGR